MIIDGVITIFVQFLVLKTTIPNPNVVSDKRKQWQWLLRSVYVAISHTDQCVSVWRSQLRTSSWTGSMFSLRGLSVGLEFPVWQLAESDYWREQFQTISEDVSVRNVLMHSAQWRFHDDALYKSTIYLLTCLLTCLLDTACLLCSPYGTFSTEPVASIFRMR